MEIKNAYKAQKLFAEIEILDKRIIDIEKLAIKLSDHTPKGSTLSLQVDFGEQTNTPPHIDMEGYQMGLMSFMSQYTVKEKQKKYDTLHLNLGSSDIYLILDVLLRQIKNGRRILLEEIKQLQ